MTHSNPSAGHDPGLPDSSFSGLMAGLLMPMADAEMEDRELAKLEARAAREAKERAKNAWHVVYMRVEAARHTYVSVSYLRSAVVFGSSTEAEKAQAATDETAAFRLYVHAVDALMRVPAPHIRGLRWKQEHAHLRADWRKHLHSKKKEPNPEWARFIAEDKARLVRT